VDVAASFKRLRPRDTHLSIGISNTPRELIYNKFEDAVYNSFSPEWAQRFEVQERVPIACLPLTKVLDEHCPGRRVDLLSVDCEGHDMEVLQSLDWERYRPTVVISEDFEQFTNGATPSASSSAMRTFLLAQDYALASQAIFSFFYVDRRAFDRREGYDGFRLDYSQLGRLAAPRG